jgi:Serine carboxypeptidase S28
MDLWNFFDAISGVASYVVQSHYVLSQNIQNACNVITDPAIRDDVAAYAEFVQAFTQRRCVQYKWWDLLVYFSGTTWESPAGVNEWRQWLWQTCNEFGMYQVLTSRDSPFGARVPSPVLYTRICSEAYSHQ